MTPDEARVMDYLAQAFIDCEKLQQHIAEFIERGSMYKICGDTLLFHAVVPMNPDGTLKETTIFGQTYAGRALYDAVDAYVRDAFAATDPVAKKRGCDFLWYLWLGEGSPLFAKSKMATLEIYLIADKAAQKEVKNSFYSLLEDDAALDGIFREFGIEPARGRIVCGHTPVKVVKGEDPVKCGGRALIIDGGMSRAYQSSSGVGGFVLADCPDGSYLGTIEPFALEPFASLPPEEDDGLLHCEWRKL